jgi:hypothetical protein
MNENRMRLVMRIVDVLSQIKCKMSSSCCSCDTTMNETPEDDTIKEHEEKKKYVSI